MIGAIYGCIELALQWYNFYTQTFKVEGYKLNEYDKYVSNKTINGKQCTLVWYVDNNKASHVNLKVIDNILEIIRKNWINNNNKRKETHLSRYEHTNNRGQEK